MKALALEFVRVVEEAVIEAARTMGCGEPDQSDQVAVHAMRREFEPVSIDGTIVIGEGCRTYSLVITRSTNKVRFVDAVHMHRPPGPHGVRLY